MTGSGINCSLPIMSPLLLGIIKKKFRFLRSDNHG